MIWKGPVNISWQLHRSSLRTLLFKNNTNDFGGRCLGVSSCSGIRRAAEARRGRSRRYTNSISRPVFPFSFAQHDRLIGGSPGKVLSGAVRPHDVNGVHLSGGSKTEVGARVIAAQVTVAGIHEAQPLATAGMDRYLRSVGIATPKS